MYSIDNSTEKTSTGAGTGCVERVLLTLSVSQDGLESQVSSARECLTLSMLALTRC